MYRIVVALGMAVVAGSVQPVRAQEQETVLKRVWFLVGSHEEEITYHPSEKAYKKLRDDTLDRLRVCDPAAFFNPADSSWKREETTTEWSIDLPVAGASTARTLVREIVAAEEALELFEKEGGHCPK